MAKGGFLQALPFLGGAAALAAPFLAPALIGADVAGGAAGAAGAADVAGAAAPAAAGITAGAAPALATTGADIVLPDVAVTASPLAGGDIAAGGAGIGAGLGDALQGAAPALGTAAGIAGPSSSSVLGTSGGLPGPPAGASVNALATGPATPIDPSGFAAPSTDIPGDVTDFWGQAGPGGYLNTASTPESGGEGGFLSSAGNFLAKNKGWIGPAAAIGGLGLEAIQGLKPVPGSQPVSGVAGTANTNAANLMSMANPNLSALATGTLPAGAQSAIDQASNAAKASIRSEFANMGITGPYSGESEALASVDQNVAAQKLQQMQSLVNVGATEAGLAQNQEGLASQDYQALMDAQIKQQAALQLALSRFAGSLAGPALATTAAAA